MSDLTSPSCLYISSSEQLLQAADIFRDGFAFTHAGNLGQLQLCYQDLVEDAEHEWLLAMTTSQHFGGGPTPAKLALSSVLPVESASPCQLSTQLHVVARTQMLHRLSLH